MVKFFIIMVNTKTYDRVVLALCANISTRYVLEIEKIKTVKLINDTLKIT